MRFATRTTLTTSTKMRFEASKFLVFVIPYVEGVLWFTLKCQVIVLVCSLQFYHLRIKLTGRAQEHFSKSKNRQGSILWILNKRSLWLYNYSLLKDNSKIIIYNLKGFVRLATDKSAKSILPNRSTRDTKVADKYRYKEMDIYVCVRVCEREINGVWEDLILSTFEKSDTKERDKKVF